MRAMCATRSRASTRSIGVSDADRELAFANIKKAAAHYGVTVKEKSWHDLGSRR